MTADGGVEYVVGDATEPRGVGHRIVVHVCNDVGGWGAGFVLALSRRWPEPEAAYARWYAGRHDVIRADAPDPPFALGSVQFVPVGGGITVANLIGQRDIVPDADGRPPVRYDAIEVGLTAVASYAGASTPPATVHMPRIGSGLAGGRWEEVAAVVDRTLIAAGVATTVYDLPPR